MSEDAKDMEKLLEDQYQPGEPRRELAEHVVRKYMADRGWVIDQISNLLKAHLATRGIEADLKEEVCRFFDLLDRSIQRAIAEQSNKN